MLIVVKEGRQIASCFVPNVELQNVREAEFEASQELKASLNSDMDHADCKINNSIYMHIGLYA